MGGVFFVVAMVITIYSYISTGMFDEEQTRQNKEMAEKDNAYTYTHYKGKVQKNYLRNGSSRKQVYEMNGLIKEMETGKVLFDIYEENKNRRQAYVKEVCKRRGYDFYPLIQRQDEKRRCDGHGCPILIEENTKNEFYFSRGNLDKTQFFKFYVDKTIDDKFGPLPHQVDRQINYFEYNIICEMMKLVEDSYCVYRRF